MKIAYITTIKIPSPQAISEQVLNNLSALSSHSDLTITLIAPKRKDEEPSSDTIRQYYGLKTPVKIQFMMYARWMGPKLRRFLHPFLAPLYCSLKGFDVFYTRHPTILFFCLLLHKKTVFDTYRMDLSYDGRYLLWRKFCLNRRKLIGIFSHSELARQSYIKAGFDPDKIITVYNGCNDRFEESCTQRAKVRTDLNIPHDQIVVCYAGRIESKKKRTDLLLHIAHEFPDIVFLIVGGATQPSEDAVFDDSIKALGLNNVIRTGMVKPCEVMNYLCASDILIIPPSEDPLHKCGKTVLPLKTFQYLSARKAILAPRLPDIGEVLNHMQNAVLVTPGDLSEANQQLQVLIVNHDLRTKLSNQCAEDIKKYTWEYRANQIAGFLHQHTSEGR